VRSSAQGSDVSDGPEFSHARISDVYAVDTTSLVCSDGKHLWGTGKTRGCVQCQCWTDLAEAAHHVVVNVLVG